MRAAVPFREAFHAIWRRDTSTQVLCILAAGAVFAAAVYAGSHSARYWDGLFRLVMLRAQNASSPHAGSTSRHASDEALRLLDQRDTFGQAPIGQLKFSTHGSDVCRHMMFDNRTGTLTDAGLTACGRAADAAENLIGENRALAMQRAFRR